MIPIDWIFVLTTVLFSVAFARIESGLDSFWVDLGAKGGWFWGKLLFGTKWTPYHATLLVLAMAVNIPTLVFGSLSLYLACVLIFPLLEDAAYFWWLKKWIKPTDWTAKEGSVTIRGVTIPYWYFVVGAAIGLLLTFS